MAGELPDVLISYSRKDQEFVRRFSAALIEAKRTTWVDWKDIPLSAKWLGEIESAIEAANTFAFIISPDSISSEICRAEIHHATQHRKRIIGIVCRDVDAKIAPQGLAEWQWLFFRPQDDFDAAFQSLIAALDTDLEYVRFHTRVLVRAREWEDRNRNRSFLLRGKDLQNAKNWLELSAEKKPEPTALHRQYIDASRRDVGRQRTVRACVAAVVVLLVVAAYAYFLKARHEDLISRHDHYATALNLAEKAHSTGNFAGVLELLQQQGPKPGQEDLREFAWHYLWRLYDNHRHAVFVQGGAANIALSLNSRTLAITNDAHTLTLWDVFTGKQLLRIEDPENELTKAFFALDGTALVTNMKDGAVWIWESILQNQKKTRILEGRFRDMEVSPNGKILVAAGSLLKLVNLESKTEYSLEDLNAHGEIAGWSFTADSGTFALAYQFSTVRLFDTAQGKLTGQVDLRDTSSVTNVCWKDGKVLAIGVSGKVFHEIVLWDVGRKKEMLRLQGPEVKTGKLVSIACDPNGKIVSMLVGDATIASPAQTNHLIAWNPNSGRRLFALGQEESGFITALQFSPDGEVLATGSKDHVVRLWNTSTGSLRNVLGIHHGEPTREHEEQNLHRDSNVIFARQETYGGGVSKVLFSRDGKTLVTASRVHGTVRIWNANVEPDNRQLPQRAEHHTANAFSPDGERIVTGDQDGTIALWDAHQHSKLAAVQGHPAAVEGLAFAKNGERFVSDADGAVKVWRTATLEQEAVFTEGPISPGLFSVELFLNDRVLLVVRRQARERKASIKAWDLATKRKLVDVASSLGAFAANGSRLVSVDQCRITVWNLALWTSNRISNRLPCGSGVQQAVLSPDGNYLAVGAPEIIPRPGKDSLSGVRLFHLAHLGDERILPLQIGFNNDDALTSLEFSPNSRLLAAVSALPDSRKGAAVTLWNVERGEKMAVPEQPASEICQGFTGSSCRRIGAFSPDGGTLAIIGGPSLPQAGANEITLWHWNTERKEILTSNHRVDRLVFSPDGESFATLISSSTAGEPTVLWETRSGKEVATLGNYRARISSFNSTVNGRTLAVAYEQPASTNIAFKAWNLSIGQVLAPQPNWGTNVTGLVSFSPGSPRLGVGRGDDSILVWDLDRGQVASTLSVKTPPSEAATFSLSPDGGLLISNTKDQVLVWGLSSGKILKEFAGSSPATFDPTGKTLATTIDCKTVKVWNLATGGLKASLSGNTSCPRTLVFSPNGKMLVTLSRGDRLVSLSDFTRILAHLGNMPAEARLWDVESGKSSSVLQGYEADDPQVASFAPDGKTLATSGKDGSVHLWDPLTGRRLLSLQGSTQAVTGLEFSSDGKALAVGYETEVQTYSSERHR